MTSVNIHVYFSNNYLLSTCYVPGTSCATVNKTDTILPLGAQWGMHAIEQVSQSHAQNSGR